MTMQKLEMITHTRPKINLMTQVMRQKKLPRNISKVRKQWKRPPKKLNKRNLKINEGFSRS